MGKKRGLVALAVVVAVAAALAGAVEVRHRRNADRGSFASPIADGALLRLACAGWDSGLKPEITGRDWDNPIGGAHPARTTLPNGLTYAVLPTKTLPGDIELRLAVDAGSVNETPEQSGAAHFLEHMLFNGTEHFPGGALRERLGALGVSLGADLNAFTTEDETVYTLSIRKRDATTLDTALDVLRDWAGSATIDQAATEAERGVVASERRSRVLGPDGRGLQRTHDVVVEGTPYAGRDPIGTADAIDHMSATTLRAFYDRWYRPDRMAVIVSGDVDPAATTAAIKARFSSLTVRAEGAPPRSRITVPERTAPTLRTATDPEADVVTTGLYVRLRPGPDTTRHQRYERIAEEAALLALERRLDREARRGGPFFAATSGRSAQRGMSTAIFEVRSTPADAKAAAKRLIRIVQEQRTIGISDQDYAAAEDQAYADLDDVADRRARAHPYYLARDALATFLADEPFVDPAVDKDVLEGMSQSSVDDAFAQVTRCSSLEVLSEGPARHEAELPTHDDQVAGLLAALGPRPEPELPVKLDQLPKAPAPVTATSRTPVALMLDATRLTYANGLTVLISPFPKTGSVSLAAVRPGGYRSVPEGDVQLARASARMVDRSGAGSIDAAALAEHLDDHGIALASIVGPATDQLFGSSSPSELDALLAVTRLRLTEPHVDPSALAAERGSGALADEASGLRADLAEERAANEARYGTSPANRANPTPEEAAAFTAEAAVAAYLAHFGNADGFTFVLAGDLDLTATIALADRYLGTLPSAGRHKATVAPLAAHPGPVRKDVRAGTDAQASLRVTFETAPGSGPDVRVLAAVLERLLRDRLFDEVREALSATYSPDVSVRVSEPPDGILLARVSLGVDAAAMEQVAGAVDRVIESLRTTPPTPAELQAIVGQLVEGSTEGAFYVSDVVADAVSYALDPTREPSQARRFATRLRALTPEAVRAFASTSLTPDRRIEVRQLPA